MKTILSVIVATMFLTLNGIAHNNDEKAPKSFSISGKVIDANESLTGVKVILDGKETTVYTDFDGNFTIDNVLEGEHTVAFSLVTYNNQELTFNPKENSKLVVELKAK